jgi:hypothetical protein
MCRVTGGLEGCGSQQTQYGHIHGTSKVAAVNSNDHFLIWKDEHKLNSPF